MKEHPLLLAAMLATLLCYEGFLHAPTGETIIPLLDAANRPFPCDWRVKAGAACINGELYIQDNPETYKMLPSQLPQPKGRSLRKAHC